MSRPWRTSERARAPPSPGSASQGRRRRTLGSDDPPACSRCAAVIQAVAEAPPARHGRRGRRAGDPDGSPLDRPAPWARRDAPGSQEARRHLAWDQGAWESFSLVRVPAVASRSEWPRAMADAVAVLRTLPGPPRPDPVRLWDGFHGAFWRRPEAYLDPRVRTAISTYAAIRARERDGGLSGSAPTSRAGAGRPSLEIFWTSGGLDLGYRLIVVDEPT